MFALGINYLNGWAMAAAVEDGARKEQAEWPPHPDRVFMALAAAWFETGEDPAEGEALRWLETLPPPAIAASGHTTRSPVVSYVPVNDSSVSRRVPDTRELSRLRDAGLSLLPEHRNRQPRGFPVAIPHDPTVYFIWQDAELNERRAALESLAAKVTHVGHSASFVRAWVIENEDVTPSLVPVEGIAEHRLRTFSTTGRLDTLIQEYDMGRYPTRTRWQGYAKPADPEIPDVPGSLFDPNLVVLSIKGRRVPLTTTLRLTQALRGALMDACPEQPPPEWFSGHTPRGTPTTSPHMALLPLPFTGSQHADGRVMGLALALPRTLHQRDAARCLSPFLYEPDTGQPRSHRLFDGRWFECQVELETRQRPQFNLRPSTWTQPSRVWATVTPVVLNRHFEGSDRWERAAESMKTACEHIGLPRPRELLLHPTSLVEGVPLSREFPRLPRKRDGGLQRHTHAIVIFDEPVRGPVLLGAGRFRGYGLCRPMDNGERRR